MFICMSAMVPDLFVSSTVQLFVTSSVNLFVCSSVVFVFVPAYLSVRLFVRLSASLFLCSSNNRLDIHLSKTNALAYYT